MVLPVLFASYMGLVNLLENTALVIMGDGI